MNLAFRHPLLMPQRQNSPFLTSERAFTRFGIGDATHNLKLWNLKKRPRNHKSLSIRYISYTFLYAVENGQAFGAYKINA